MTHNCPGRSRHGRTIAALLMALPVGILLGSPANSVADEPTTEFGMKLVGEQRHAHGHGCDMALVGSYAYLTKRESSRLLDVIDVSDVTRPHIVADLMMSRYRSDDMLACDNGLLINTWQQFQFVAANDASVRTIPPPWTPDPDRGTQRAFYAFDRRDDLLVLADADPRRALRIYRITGGVAAGSPIASPPKLLAGIDLSRELPRQAEDLVSIPNDWGLHIARQVIIDGNMVHAAYGGMVLGVDISNPESPRVVYRFSPGMFIEGIAVRGTRLFVATSDRGSIGSDKRKLVRANESRFGVLEVTLEGRDAPGIIAGYRDMDLPERLLIDGDRLFIFGSQKTGTEVEVDGVNVSERLHHGYLGRQATLHIASIENSGTITRIGEIKCPVEYEWGGQTSVSICRRMALRGNQLFVAQHDFGLRVFDVSDSATPRSLGAVRTVVSETNGVVLTDHGAVMTSLRGLLPVADPDAPGRKRLDENRLMRFPSAFRSGIITKEDPFWVATPVHARDVIAAWDMRGDQPKLVAIHAMTAGREVRQIVSRGEWAYAITITNDQREMYLQVFRARDGDWRQLEAVSECLLARFRIGVSWWGTLLFDVQDNRAVGIVKAEASDGTERAVLIGADISDPVTPHRLGPAALPDLKPGIWKYASRMLDGNRLYVYAGVEGAPTVHVYDISELAKPRLLASMTETNGYRYADLTVMKPGHLVAVQDYMRGIRLIDVSDATHPRLVWQEPAEKDDDYATIGWSAGIGRGDRLYVPRLDRLRVFELTDERSKKAADPSENSNDLAVPKH